MELVEYLKDTNQTDGAFAQRVGCSVSQMNQIKRGRQLPSFPLAVRIEKETAGLVDCLSIFDFYQRTTGDNK